MSSFKMPKRPGKITKLYDNAKKAREIKEENSRESYMYTCQSILLALVNVQACRDCQSTGCFTLDFLSLDYMNQHYKMSCSNCNFSHDFWTCGKEFNTSVVFSRTMAGITESQFTRYNGGIGFSAKTVAGKEMTPCADGQKSTAAKIQKEIDEAIEDETNRDCEKKLDEFIHFHKKNPEEEISLSTDGAYNDRAILKNNAQACFVSVIGLLDGHPYVLGRAVFKKTKEATQKSIDNAKGRLAPKGTPASGLEIYGINYLFETVILKIHQNLPKKKINICADCDASVKKTTFKYLSGPKEGEEIVPKSAYNWTNDTSHISKNIHGVVKRGLVHGSGKDKFTPRQIADYGNRVQSAHADIVKKKMTFEEAKDKLEKTRKHAYGDHSKCDVNCPRIAPILQPHGNLTEEKIKTQIDELMEKRFGDEFIRKILNCGSSSYNEYLHSIIVNRKLFIKGDYAGLNSLRYESATSLAVMI